MTTELMTTDLAAIEAIKAMKHRYWRACDNTDPDGFRRCFVRHGADLDYGAIGTVTNLASRLCGEAKGGQILTSRKTLSDVEHLVDAEPVGELHLKGFARPVTAFNIKA